MPVALPLLGPGSVSFSMLHVEAVMITFLAGSQIKTNGSGEEMN
jgi:hypothetical protein